ncbi:hypothetical protein LTR84_005521 [Exophiala bonariae]|uniref:SnoaL-like domain-containing protein n=1 Tax=Exophiala bonariae TaxID=1690606 RepID=A0AAV9N4C8_9EURO|nr:hypothetical protein LTR84_005521 [Exophiala bonariae]
MTSITISSERVAQVDAVVRKFVAGFHKPIESIDEFTSIYSPDIEWADHAFLIRRVGHEAVIGLQRGFTWCNQPFKAEIKTIIPTATGAIFEQVWVGRHANDLVRPNGDVAVKATGKDFECHVLMVLQIDGGGIITRIDEFYNKHWEDGIREQDYLVMKGASMKSKV